LRGQRVTLPRSAPLGSAMNAASLPRALVFAMVNSAAVLAALFIAFAANLERPYWAMFSVLVIAQPIAGTVRSKTTYRLAGTFVGAAFSLWITPLLVQAPLLLCLVIALWIGACVYVSQLDRTPRSYAFMLAGYTAAIVSFSVTSAPGAVWDVTVARVEEISVGVLCGAVAHSILFPQSVVALIDSRIQALLDQSARAIAATLKDEETTADLKDEAQFAAALTDLNQVYTHVAFEAEGAERSRASFRVLQADLTELMPRLSGLREVLAALRNGSSAPIALQDGVAAAADWARARAVRDEPVAPLLARLDLIASSLPANDTTWDATLVRTAVRTLVDLVRGLNDGYASAVLFRERRGPIDWRSRMGLGEPAPTLFVDHRLALLSAVATVLATLFTSALWIQGAWPEGGAAAQFAAIGCALSATRDEPAKMLGPAIFGILIGTPIAALFQFALLPQIDGFVMLALALTPMLVVFSLLQAFEKTAGLGLILAITFAGGLALQSAYAADFAAFCNLTSAEVIGFLIALVVMRLVRTIAPLSNARRIARTGWEALSRLARGAGLANRAWLVAMTDRMGLIEARLASIPAGATSAPELDCLRDMRVGLNVTALRQAENALDPPLRETLALTMRRVAESYEARAAGSPKAIAPELAMALGEALHMNWPATQRDAIVSALTMLRLDLLASADPLPEPAR
jgi:uncharacterized membrane protein YccC